MITDNTSLNPIDLLRRRRRCDGDGAARERARGCIQRDRSSG